MTVTEARLAELQARAHALRELVLRGGPGQHDEQRRAEQQRDPRSTDTDPGYDPYRDPHNPLYHDPDHDPDCQPHPHGPDCEP